MFELIIVSAAFIFISIILYIFYRINKIQIALNLIITRLNNSETIGKKLPKKQTGFGTGRAKDEHTVTDHDIYHY